MGGHSESGATREPAREGPMSAGPQDAAEAGAGCSCGPRPSILRRAAGNSRCHCPATRAGPTASVAGLPGGPAAAQARGLRVSGYGPGVDRHPGVDRAHPRTSSLFSARPNSKPGLDRLGVRSGLLPELAGGHKAWYCRETSE